jgi:AraC-like DNA-binding protein
LADRLVDVQDVATPGLRRLVADTGRAPTLAAALVLMQRGLERLFVSVPPTDARVQAALAGMARSGGGVPMHRLHAALGTSPRWLERRFRDDVGVSPKRLARLMRFQGALAALVAEPRQPCAQVAAGHGYFDQAHFTAEFHAFSGHAPREFVQGRLDELTRAFAGRAAGSN